MKNAARINGADCVNVHINGVSTIQDGKNSENGNQLVAGINENINAIVTVKTIMNVLRKLFFAISLSPDNSRVYTM